MRFVFIISVVLIVSSCTSRKSQEVTVDFYGLNYQECLDKARSKTEFTHHTMHEETLGHAINNCMSEYGWVMDGKEIN